MLLRTIVIDLLMGKSFWNPIMQCKCGHPNKPCHRSSHWYDKSRACKECNCNEFVRRDADKKYNKGIEIGIIVGLSLACVLLLLFGGTLNYLYNVASPQILEKQITISTGSIINFLELAVFLGALYLGGFVFDSICLYYKTHRKSTMPIDERWKSDK